MGERRDRNPELDEALLQPPAGAGPSKRVYLKRSDIDAHGLARRHTRARSLRRREELLQGTAKGRQRLQEAERRTRDTAGERAAKRSKLQFADRPVNLASSSSAVNPASSSSAGPSAGGDAVSAGNVVAQDAINVVAGGVAQDPAQDAVMSGGADGRRNSPREKEYDEERVKRQRTEKKTELEMVVSTVGEDQ